MEELVDLLHRGGYSCVIRNDSEQRTFTQRGVADLFQLCNDSNKFLQGAAIADKVVGKGAAALMVFGGVARLHADVISTPALALLRQYGVETTYSEEAPFIANRQKDGVCPVETLCTDLTSPEEMYLAIQKFLKHSS